MIGAYPLDGSDVTALKRIGVRRVLNLAQDSEYPRGQRELVVTALEQAELEETRVEFVDHGPLPPEALEESVQQVLAWLQAGELSYVHCRAGWQRSAAVAAGVVAIQDSVGIETALSRVQARKDSARPLPRQLEDLLRWWDTRGE
ncbi:MAG: hypothetical protein ABI323_05500 [Solirubrobacteraceae bacterium]